MRTLTIDQINGLDNGDIIPSFTARIIKMWPPKRGESQYGPWLLQNLDVQDETGETKVTWGGEDELTGLEGKTVTFESVETKHGLQGIKREIRTSGGKTYEGVKLTGVCKILTGGNGDHPLTAPPASSAPRQGAFAPRETQGARTVASEVQRVFTPEVRRDLGITPPDVNSARRRIMQIANLLLLCKRAADTVLKEPDPEDGRTIMIQACREGLLNAMPDDHMIETRATAEPFKAPEPDEEPLPF